VSCAVKTHIGRSLHLVLVLTLYRETIPKQQQGGLDSVKRNAFVSESSIRDEDNPYRTFVIL
jgi:hypothetical protein